MVVNLCTDNSEFITTMTMNPPFGITRDIVVHAFGANCLAEQNAIVLVTKSLTDSDHDKEISESCTIPPVNKGFFSDRVHLNYLYCVNTMTSSSSTKFNAVMQFDPKLGFGLPGSIMSWFINQLAGVVFPLLRKQAVYVSNLVAALRLLFVLLKLIISSFTTINLILQLADADPYDNSYTNQIRNSSTFYIDFLLPMYRAYVQRQGWVQPTIRCLYDKGIPQNGFDYSTPFTVLGGEGLSPHKLSIQLSMSPAIKRKIMPKLTGGDSPGGRSDVSADFYSCLDDEEYQVGSKPSVDWGTRTLGGVARSHSSRSPLFDDDESSTDLRGEEYNEPFLEDRSLIKCSDEGETQKDEGGVATSSQSSCCAPWQRCMRWLCCAGL